VKSRSAKNKGMGLQQYICHRFSLLSRIPWGEDELISSRPMGQSGVDIVLIGKALELFPFSIECKKHEKWNVQETISQAIQNTKQGTAWLVIYSKNNQEPISIFEESVFLSLYSKEIRNMYFEEFVDKKKYKALSLQKWIYTEKLPKRKGILFKKGNVNCVAISFRQFLLLHKRYLISQNQIEG
jgi:hypothetical protein